MTLTPMRFRLWANSNQAPLRSGQVLLWAALTIGLVLRLAPALGAGFPLLDGGLFATMAHDLRQAHFALPLYSSFNAGNVPFAYPPLGLYVLAAIPGDPVLTERWLPLVYSMLSIGSVYLLARELLDERLGGLSAVLYAAMPITWVIEGGGVTRGLGLLLMLLTLWRVACLLRAQTWRNIILAGGLGGLAVLSHPSVGPATAASFLLLVALRPSRARWRALVGAGALASLITLPWVGLVLGRYGLSAFATAAAAGHDLGYSILYLLTVGPSWVNPFDFVAPLAILGIVLSIRKRQWRLPLWAVLLVLVPGAVGREAAFVWAMLAAIGASAALELGRGNGTWRLPIAVGLLWIIIASFVSGYQRYTAIPPAVRSAMVAAGEATEAGTRFAIVCSNNDLRGLALDWFPALSHRISLGTSMGLEWTTAQTFRSALGFDREIQLGALPPETDEVFVIARGSATWYPVN